MKVSARIVRGKGISIKRLGKAPQEHTAGTVIMQNVKFGRAVMGDVIEENEKVILPRSADMMAIRNWPTARYIARLGHYIDTDTGQRVNSATFVYMAGDKVYYW
jgi:hypothetical protein